MSDDHDPAAPDEAGAPLLPLEDDAPLLPTEDPAPLLPTEDDATALRTEDQGPVRWITIDRPARRNALNLAQRHRLAGLLAEADNDPAVRCVVLTGTDPSFSAGVDIKERNPLTPQDRRFRVNPGKALRAMLTPTIAAVNGVCMTGGLEMALSCHIAVASDRATFADSHTKLGVLPGWGLSALLPRTVGPGRAHLMSLTGRFLDARTAAEWGMVGEVVPHDRLREAVQELAEAVADMDGDTVRDLLRLYARGQGASLAEALAFEEDTLVSRQNKSARDSRHRVLKPSEDG